MVLTVTLPELGQSKGSSTKDLIVSILSHEWPLSTKQLFNRIKGENGFSVSYQAVHKALQELLEVGAVKKSSKGYSFSLEWIEGIEMFSKQLKEKYNGNGLLSQKFFVLNSVSEVDMFFLELFKEIVKVEGKQAICLQWTHYWLPLFFNKEAYRKFKEILSASGGYATVLGTTAVDKWCEQFWKQSNVRAKSGVAPHNHSDFIVYGNFVIQVYYPREIREKIFNVFSKVKKVEEVNWAKFYEEVLEEKTTIPLTIDKNPVLAESLRNQVLSHFKNEKKNG